jgi:hypothetical protein
LATFSNQFVRNLKIVGYHLFCHGFISLYVARDYARIFLFRKKRFSTFAKIKRNAEPEGSANVIN